MDIETGNVYAESELEKAVDAFLEESETIEAMELEMQKRFIPINAQDLTKEEKRNKRVRLNGMSKLAQAARDKRDFNAFVKRRCRRK
jgi:hypothetical protein